MIARSFGGMPSNSRDVEPAGEAAIPVAGIDESP
jgi:hypothetical protein